MGCCCSEFKVKEIYYVLDHINKGRFDYALNIIKAIPKLMNEIHRVYDCIPNASDNYMCTCFGNKSPYRNEELKMTFNFIDMKTHVEKIKDRFNKANINYSIKDNNITVNIGENFTLLYVFCLYIFFVSVCEDNKISHVFDRKTLIEIVIFLCINSDINRTLADKNGNTPLHLLACTSEVTLITLLTHTDYCDVKKRNVPHPIYTPMYAILNNKSQSPIILASLNNNDNVIECFNELIDSFKKAEEPNKIVVS